MYELFYISIESFVISSKQHYARVYIVAV